MVDWEGGKCKVDWEDPGSGCVHVGLVYVVTKGRWCAPYNQACVVKRHHRER